MSSTGAADGVQEADELASLIKEHVGDDIIS